MKKLNVLGLGLAVGFAPMLGLTSMQQSSSAKATARVGDMTLMDTESQQGWTTIMDSQLKCSNQKDILVDVSLEVGLMTKTLVRSKGGSKDTSTAEAAVKVRVLCDGMPIQPGEVIFGSRKQVLTAKFQGIIDKCFSIDENGNVVLDESCVEAEELELLLDTTNAASFGFVAPNVSQGMHKFEVQCLIDTNVNAEAGTADAVALVGKGSVAVEEVRTVKGDSIDM